MTGDAPCDEKAAEVNGVLCYPILMNYEAESWERFLSEAIDRFRSGNYSGTYQEEQRAAFRSNLGF